MEKKKRIAVGTTVGLAAVALIIGIVTFYGSKKATADQLDYNSIKEQLKEELSTEYDTKFTEQQIKIDEQQKKIDELNSQLSAKEIELKNAIKNSAKDTEKKITYDKANENLEEERKKNPQKVPEPDIATPAPKEEESDLNK